MLGKKFRFHREIDLIGLIGLIFIQTILVAACQSTPLLTKADTITSTLDLSKPSQTITASVTTSVTLTVTPSATNSPTPTSTATSTPTRYLLDQFDSSELRDGVQPVGYLAETCTYLNLRWGKDKAEPGTVVIPVMFHSIVQPPSKVNDPKDITVEEFQSFIYYASFLGFETITTQELANFLYFNDPIPKRSMILIVDDRRPGLLYEHFIPVLEANDWTVTSAYIANPNEMDWAWDWMERMVQHGRLDVQSHGYSGQLYVLPDTPIDQIQEEIWNSTPVLEEHFGKRPIAFIWPGGNFTQLAVQVARQGDYQLGFSAYSRGPLLFNWVPLGEEERLVGDPLMVLPRAWSNSVNYNLDEALKISYQAAAFATANKDKELSWMSTYCAGE